jgi:hypothetical protein
LLLLLLLLLMLLLLLLLLSSGRSGCVGSSKGGGFVDEEHARHVDVSVRGVRDGGIAQRGIVIVRRRA